MDFFLSTIAPDAALIARENNLGLEIAEYCTAWNMDEKFGETDPIVRRKLEGIRKRILHGPFNELFPCAIDPKIRDIARQRYRQAIQLAKEYGVQKVVIHGGYNPRLYYPVWYTEQSVIFWKAFIQEVPRDMEIVLENVLEEEPAMLLDIIRQVEDPRLGMCLDVGHVNAYSKVPVMEWLELCSPYIRHFHIHNNEGSWDSHNGLADGTIPMKLLLSRVAQLCPDASVTLEVMESAPSVRWLKEELWNR